MPDSLVGQTISIGALAVPSGIPGPASTIPGPPGGPPGPIGPQGAIGSQGPQGDRGDQGPVTIAVGPTITGIPGTQASVVNTGTISDLILAFTVPEGLQGVQGPQGFQGSQGSQGVQGAIGAQGVQGSQGSQGAVGPQGSQGSQGAQGFQGFQGPQGSIGPQGSQGSQGSQGAIGAQGFQGVQGSQGSASFSLIAAPFTVPAVGGSVQITLEQAQWVQIGAAVFAEDNTLGALVVPSGLPGPASQIPGPPGGPPGPQGAIGAQGAQGAQGVPGPVTVAVGPTITGVPGTQAAVANTGTVSNVVLAFTIPAGLQGVQGAQGIQGPQGVQGVQGPQGDIGPTSWTTVGTQFTEPAVGSNVAVTVGDTRWMTVGAPLRIGGRIYAIVNIISATAATLQLRQ